MGAARPFRQAGEMWSQKDSSGELCEPDGDPERAVTALEARDENDRDPTASLAATHHVGRHDLFVFAGTHADVDVWSTEIGRRNGPFESECAGSAGDHACVTPPVVAAVRALLPQLDDGAADTCAVRITEDKPGEDMPSADAGTPRRRRAVRLERAGALGLRRAAGGRPWRCRAGAYEPHRPHDRGGRKEPACQAVTSREPSASHAARSRDHHGRNVASVRGSGF
jgi:hypothetical protein